MRVIYANSSDCGLAGLWRDICEKGVRRIVRVNFVFLFLEEAAAYEVLIGNASRERIQDRPTEDVGALAFSKDGGNFEHEI